MNRIICIVILQLLLGGNIYCQKLSKTLPFNKDVVHGKLENGLTYYIYHNEEPKGKANFYIVQNVGALLEEDNQQGLAHFLEHMAFNGTTHFPGNTMVSTLEKFGLSFGSEINAMTGKEETIYNINNVPVKENIIDTCLLVLHDWANEISLDTEEIDKERGVISEEYRQRMNAGMRVSKKVSPTIFNGSMYSKRDIIGPLEIINGFKPETINKFYNDWYRADLQAIIVVGDIDVKQIENKIKALFSKIPKVENAKPRPEFTIADNDKLMYCVGTDKELGYETIQYTVRSKQDNSVESTYADLYDAFKLMLVNQMIGNKLGKISRVENTPYLQAQISFGTLVRGYDAYKIAVIPKAGKSRESFKRILEINKGICEHGFSNAEFMTAKTSLILNINEYYRQRKLADHNSFAMEFKDNFLTNNPIIPIETFFSFFKKTMNKLTVKQVNDYVKELYGEKNRSVCITGPDNKEYLSEEEVNALIEGVEGTTTNANKEKSKTKKKLFVEKLSSVDIKSSDKISSLGAEIFTLSNGAKVVYKYCNKQPEKVQVIAKSLGGYSLIPAEDFMSVSVFNEVIGTFGLGEHDYEDLKDILINTSVRYGRSVEELSEKIEGACKKEDFEKLMQVLYMSFEQPRFDRFSFDKYKSDLVSTLETKKDEPTKVFVDSLRNAANVGNPRLIEMNIENTKKIDFETIKRIYAERFSNASDYIFYVIGDISKSKVKKLASMYIGNIKSTGKKENFKDLGNYFPKGRTEAKMQIELQKPAATSMTQYQSYMEFNQANIMAYSIMIQALNLRLTEEIREKEGGTYSIGARGGVRRFPTPKWNLSINFGCDPLRQDELKEKIEKLIQRIIDNGVLNADYQKAISGIAKRHSMKNKDNAYWMSVLREYTTTGIDKTSKAYFEDVMKNMTKEKVNKLIKEFFSKANVIDFSFKSKPLDVAEKN